MNYSNIKNLKKIVDSTGGVDYSGPVVYENGAVKRVMFDGGDATFADAGKGSSLQPYKFGGKELDAMYGLNIYDFHARTQTPDLARFTRPDPLAEKTPHLSPYLFCANDPVNNIDPTGMIVEFIGDSPEKEEKLRTNIDFLRSNSPIFNEIYNNLESLSDIFTVGFGITSETGDGENARGEYLTGEKAIVFDMTDEIPMNQVISEEFYHAYQEANKCFNFGEWNRGFEAKVATAAICGESQSLFVPFTHMETFSDSINLNSSIISSTGFASIYKIEGNKFAESYKNVINYNVPVNCIPNTLIPVILLSK